MNNKNTAATQSADGNKSASSSRASNPYNPKAYKLIGPKDVKIYNPNVVSKRRAIVSA